MGEKCTGNGENDEGESKMTYLNSFCEVLKRKLFESANIANDKVYFYKVKDINDNFFEPMSEKVE